MININDVIRILLLTFLFLISLALPKNKIIILINNKINEPTNSLVSVTLNVGRTVNATLTENISQGTSGVPLNVVIK